MIPCLYEQTERNFSTNGIGKLCDAISCTVVEKRNGSYELKMTYPTGGIHAGSITEGALVLAKPSEKAALQPFRIYKITTPLTGSLEIAARHIQYQENFITVSPFTATGCQAAMAELQKRATTDCPFSFWTDIESKATFSFTAPSTIRNCLGGMDGSLLDTYGGEYEWDMYTTRLHSRRGSDNGVRIVYGKNLIDFQMEKSIGKVITGVHPYWKHSEDGTLMELPEKVVKVEKHSLPYEKITPLDCSSHFEEKPTEEQLRNYTKKYLKNTTLTEPDIDIQINFLQLWQTPGYEDIAEAERVSLCDTVHVYISKLGIEVSCKVTETEYDVLLERYRSITLSNASVRSRNRSLSGALGSIRDEASLATEAINRMETQVTDVRTLSVQQEYFNRLTAGLMGVHYSSGMAEDGSTIRYAHTGEKLEKSQFAWMSGTNGFFVSIDGGKTWMYGWNDENTVVKLASEAVGLSADALVRGVLNTEQVKILGTDHFYWQGEAITVSDPKNAKNLLKIGRYSENGYGIAASQDCGNTWKVAVDFKGIAQSISEGGTTVVQGETIVKSDIAPENPELDALWVDKSMNPRRLKIWTGTAWEIVGYEPEPTEPEPDPEPVEPEPTEPDPEPTYPDTGETTAPDTEENPNDETTEDPAGGEA